MLCVTLHITAKSESGFVSRKHVHQWCALGVSQHTVLMLWAKSSVDIPPATHKRTHTPTHKLMVSIGGFTKNNTGIMGSVTNRITAFLEDLMTPFVLKDYIVCKTCTAILKVKFVRKVWLIHAHILYTYFLFLNGLN
jgi:hypothetical protein